MSERQMDNECFINVFKSVHGYKPRSHPFFDGSDEVRAAEWKELEADQKVEDEWMRECDHEEALMVQNLLTMGASDVATAFRWMEA